GVAQALRERGGLTGGLLVGGPVPARDQAPRRRSALGRSELQRPRDPALDELARRPPLPHPRPGRRVEGEEAVGVRVLPELERALHRLPERLTVVAEGVHESELAPDPGRATRVGLELDRALQEPERL